jgi:tetratricopeptide (TPR) repeat protein
MIVTGSAFLPVKVIMVPLLCLLWVVPGVSAADEAEARAREHNAVAKKLFNLGMFPQAAEEYLKAYKAKPEHAYLFNLAQCYKRMTTEDNLKKAIFYFRSYLQNEPRTPFRDKIEEEIDKIEKEIERLKQPPPFYKRWWFWTAVGVVAAGATVGTVLALQPEDQQPVEGTLPPHLYTGI